MFGIMFNDTGSSVAGAIFNKGIGWTLLIAAITFILVIWHPWIFKYDGVRMSIAILGALATFFAAVSPFTMLSSSSTSAAFSAEDNSRQAAAVAQNRSRIASYSRDYVCSDGTFVTIGAPDNIGTMSMTYVDPSATAETSLGYIDTTTGTFSLIYGAPEAKKALAECRNVQGKSIADLYAEFFLNSAFIPAALPVTKDEAVAVVKGLIFKHGGVSTPFALAAGETLSIFGPYHDRYRDQDYWVVQGQLSSSDQPLESYKVFLNDGKIQTN
jgi:hypothetical protein